MIPIQLELRNFMSYGEGHPVLCLDGIHVACLSGPNGHGKSTLLDAMVWALWGEPRGGARAGDDLIRHGASEMLVSFEFEAAGVRYRTLRRRTRHGKTGTTELHFESWDGDAWRPLSGGSAAETQRIITSTLHMTHDTFVHASFIAQGHADAFMGITPQQRKQVLGDVLDLGQYDLLSDAARDERRRSEAEASRLGSLIQNIESELARRDHYVELMRSAAEAEEQAKILTTRLQSERTVLLAEVNEMEILARQADVRTSELRRIEDRIRGLQGQLRDLEGRIVDARSLAQRGADIERDYEAYQRLDDEEQRLGSRFDPWSRARDDVAAAESAIHRERTRLESQLAVAREQIHELKTRHATVPDLQTEAARLYLLVARFDVCDAELAADREKLETGTATLGILRSEGERLKAEIASAEQRRALLGEHDTCPLCGQLLGADGLAAAHGRLLDECDTTQQRLERIRVDYGHQSNKIKGLQERVKGLQTELAERPTTARSLGEVEARLRQLDEDAVVLAEAREREAALDQVLQSEDYSLEQRALLEPLRARLVDIEYDHERHLALRAERDLLRNAPVHMQKLQLAQATLETHEAQRAGLEVQLVAARDEATTIERELAELRLAIAHLPDARLALTRKETELDAASRAHIAAARDLGEAKQHVDWLTEQERAQRGLIVQRTEALADVSAYTQLAEAFGKNGIQEMIIEKAIPEIEEAANELLTRLTDGRMRVTMNTQRLGRGGSNISTLDVDVSDELGTRPYELFSGGEKFRINFAIRIALSRLLARRAGVPLQMLAIDEGFGSQDRQGCDRLIEAIKAVQDDFARVLIITHLEDLKDAFPVQIEVTKTHSGSTFTIT